MHAERAATILWSHKDVDSDKVNEELKSASQQGTGGTSPAFRSAAERLNEFAKSGNKPDTLARVEIAQTIEAGAKELLLRAAERMKNRKTAYATVLSDHARLAARLSFEQNHYAEALDIMFPNSSPIALYYPSLSWISKTDFAGSAESITAKCEGENLIVGTRNNGQPMEVIQLKGLPASDACGLAKEVQNNWVPSDFGRVFERVLVTQVPLRFEAQNVRKLILEERTRLALLKAMVFREIPPAKNLVPSADAPIQEDETNTVTSYRVPTVDETVRLAKSRFNVTDN
jgi:hypothetical protein